MNGSLRYSIVRSLSEALNIANIILTLRTSADTTIWLDGVRHHLRQAQLKTESYFFHILRSASPSHRCDIDSAERDILAWFDLLLSKIEALQLLATQHGLLED